MNQEATLNRLSGEVPIKQTVKVWTCFFDRSYQHVKVISHAGGKRFVYRRKEHTSGKAISNGALTAYRSFAIEEIKDYFARQRVAKRQLQFEETITLERN